MAEESAPKKKCESIEDIPGVGLSTTKRLRELGFQTIESLAMATVRELEEAGISEKKASEIIETARSSM
jgi:DNA repair protein RadA